MNEGKKGFREKKHSSSLEKLKQRNPVAKNASAAIGGGAAGPHKDKKKAAKQGDVKHKKDTMDVFEGENYYKKLQLKLGVETLRHQLAEIKESRYGSNPAYMSPMDYERDQQRQIDRDTQDFRNRERNAGVEPETDRPQEIGRTYFKIPFEKAKEAKALYGLRWDPEKKLWFKPRYNKSGRTHDFHIQQLEKQFPIVKDVDEGAEFGTRGAEALALKVFKQNPNLSTSGRADELQDAGWAILAQEYGKKRANYFFNYDEDFPSDFVSSYGYLQDREQGVGEGSDPVADFIAKGGKIKYGKTHAPRKDEKWQGSSHIGAAGGKGTKGSVSGMAANTGKKSNKPVVSVENIDLKDIHPSEFGDPSEYDMEGDYLKNQIHTMIRVLSHLERLIDDDENLPEWVEEKFSQAKGMVVSVMDHIVSEKERSAEKANGREFDR